MMLFACTEEALQGDDPVITDSQVYAGMELEIGHAQGFDISYHDSYKQVVVFDPWNRSDTLASYILAPSGTDPGVAGTLIHVPLQRIACQSTTHLPMMNAIGMGSRVCGISHPEYVTNEESLRLIGEGIIQDIGGSNEIDLEKVLAAGPDALMVYPMEGLQYGHLREAGVDLIYNAEYMEDTPLGQAEWLKFVAAFFDQETLADSIFSEIEHAYTQRSGLARTMDPVVVMAGFTHAGIYYAPGGSSFNAVFIEDAGGAYVWNDLGGSGSNEVDMELVIEAGAIADWWVFADHTQADFSIADMELIDPRFADLGPVRNGNVLFCNTSQVNYFEDALLEPHKILADLIMEFHPTLLFDYEPKYFKRLDRGAE